MIRLFIALAGSRGVAAILLLVTNVLFARWSSPSAFGTVNAILAASTFFFVIADYGMSTYIIRATARFDPSRLITAFRLNYLSSVIGALTLSAGIFLIVRDTELPTLLLLLGIGLAFEKSADALLGAHIAQSNKREIAFITIGRRAITLALFIFGHILGAPPIASYTVAYMSGAALSWVMIRISLRNFLPPDITPIKIKLLLSEAKPFLIANASASARNLDTALVANFAGVEAAGLWSASQKLTTPFMLIPGAMASVLLPHSARAERRLLRGLALKVALAHLALTILLILPGIFTTEILNFVLGEAYIGAAPVLSWTLMAFPFIALSTSLGGILQGDKQEKFVAKNGLIFAGILLLAITISTMIAPLYVVAIAVFAVYLAKSISLYVKILASTADVS